MPIRKKILNWFEQLNERNEPNRAYINQVLDLYQSRQVARKDTAAVLINDLKSRGKVTVEKAIKIIEGYKESEPATGRLTRQIEENTMIFEKNLLLDL